MAIKKKIQNQIISFISRLMWLIAPDMTTTFIRKTFFTSRNMRIDKSHENLLRQAERFEVTVLGKTVQGWKWGSGPSVLLVHGWGVRGIKLAPLITPLTQSGYSVYTYDSLAHGDSEGDTTNFFEIVESMNAVFDHIGGADFLIGHSMGAAAAVNLRSINGKNVKLVLIAPLYDLQGMIYAHGKASGLHFPLYKKIIGKIEKKFGKTLHEVSPMTIAKNITIPALIFHDEDDMVVPVEQGELFAGELKNSRLVKTSGLGHNRILESKALFDKSLKFFSE